MIILLNKEMLEVFNTVSLAVEQLLSSLCSLDTVDTFEKLLKTHLFDKVLPISVSAATLYLYF